MDTTATIKSLEAKARATGGGHVTPQRAARALRRRGLVTATARLGDSLIVVATKLTQAMTDATADTLGSWLENDIVYYDLGTIPDDEATAQKWAEERGEIAYYDLKKADKHLHVGLTSTGDTPKTTVRRVAIRKTIQ